jgi:hypothetical protein
MPAYLGNINVENFNIGNTAIVGVGGGTFFPTDTDAIAFISASAITASADINAINYLVTSLKAYDLWDDMVVFYPMVGATTSSMKWNLMNPQDTDAAFRLEYYGGVSASSKGLVFSGAANTFANTNFYSSLDLGATSAFPPIAGNLLDSFSNGIYSETTGSITGYAAGTRASSATFTRYVIQTSNGSKSTVLFGNNFISASFTGLQDGGGLFATSFTTGSQIYYRNDTSLGTKSSTSSVVMDDDYTYVLGANNQSSNSNFPLIANPSQITIATAFMGSYLNPTKYADLNNIIQGYNNILGRKMVDSTPVTTTTTTTAGPTTTTSTTTTTTTTTVSTPATQFIATAGITNPTQQNAIIDLYDDLVSAGLWTKFVAIYPFVGGTQTSHTYNLKNTAAFPLTFNGGWTHNSNGVTSNGTTAYASTGLLANSYYEGDISIGVYSRTAGQSGVDFGSNGGIDPSDELSLQIRSTGDVSILEAAGYTNTNGTNTSGLGLFVGNVYAATQLYNGVYANGVKQGAGTNFSTINFNNRELSIAALTGPAFTTPTEFAARNYALALFGNGLVPAEQTTLYSIIQTYQTALSRQV